MPEYTPGTPSWVELSSPDADASAAFYDALFGWAATEPGPAEETGGYRMFQQGEQAVAGLMGHMQEGQPTVWATYISVAHTVGWPSCMWPISPATACSPCWNMR